MVYEVGGNNTTSKAWDSGLRVVEPKLIVDKDVELIAKAIQDDVGNDEFSVLFKGMWTDKGFKVTKEYYIPDQEVTGMSVDYEENIGIKRAQDGFNVVVHSHPFSRCRTTTKSGADEEHVSSHFPCSLITNDDGEISNAQLNLDTPNDEVKVGVEIDVDEIKYYNTAVEMEIVGLDKIKKKYNRYAHQSSNLVQGWNQYPHVGCGGMHDDIEEAYAEDDGFYGDGEHWWEKKKDEETDEEKKEIAEILGRTDDKETDYLDS